MARSSERPARRHRAALSGALIALALAGCAGDSVSPVDQALSGLDTTIGLLDEEARAYRRARARGRSRSGAYDGQLEKVQVYFNLAQRSVKDIAVAEAGSGLIGSIRSTEPPETAAEAAETAPALAPRVEKLAAIGRSLQCPGPRCPLTPMTQTFFGM